MDIIYAAEKPSIAKVLEDYIKESVEPDEIRVRANPNETGSFLIGWRFRRYVLAPNGRIVTVNAENRSSRSSTYTAS